jgi:Domain of unknown function (DUF929)
MASDGKAGRRGKASAAGQGADRRARIAAQRVAAQRTQRRNRMLIAGGAIVAVVAVVIAFVALSGSSSSNNASGTAAGPPPTGSALAAVIAATTTVPAATLDKVGAGQVSAPPTTISGTPLTSGGKPEMLYMGAEYCPYCAAERWAMVVALSRFGTFSGMAAIRSAAKDGAGQAEPFPNTPTWTFVNAHFTSTYLMFTAVEMYTNVPDPSTGGYTVLQTPTAAQQALMTKYDANGSIPFVDYGNRYLSVGASYDQSVLTGLNWSQIVADLHNPASPVAKGVLGTANYMTAAICRLTGDRPASACTPVVKSLQAKL